MIGLKSILIRFRRPIPCPMFGRHAMQMDLWIKIEFNPIWNIHSLSHDQGLRVPGPAHSPVICTTRSRCLETWMRKHHILVQDWHVLQWVSKVFVPWSLLHWNALSLHQSALDILRPSRICFGHFYDDAGNCQGRKQQQGCLLPQGGLGGGGGWIWGGGGWGWGWVWIWGCGLGGGLGGWVVGGLGGWIKIDFNPICGRRRRRIKINFNPFKRGSQQAA